jgi:leucyl-tRNA synthetase
MKIAQIMLVASLGFFLQASADEILSTPEMFSTIELADMTPYAGQSAYSVSCGFQGTLDAKAAKLTPTQAQMQEALTKAAAACGAVMNTAAQEFYTEKAKACAEDKVNCSVEEYKEMHQAWCGHMHIHPIHVGEPMPVHWAKSMDNLIAKAQKVCLADKDPVEVDAATAYFEAYKPGLCASKHTAGEQMQQSPEACVTMYHALGANSAPY